MKTIGIIGGMSWKSSLDYYQIINNLVSQKLGGWNSAEVIMYSVNFEDINIEGDIEEVKKTENKLFDVALKLENAGAELIIIGANTMHVLADKIQEKIKIPLLHIVDATAKKIKLKKIKKVGLLGTKYTMTKDFYKGRLEEKHKINVIVPNKDEIEIINKEINNIILKGENIDTKENILKVIQNMVNNGAEAIILGCTELPLVIKEEDVNIPIFDTTFIHAESAVEYSLG